MQLLNTLYITTPDAYLRLDNDTISVKVESEVKLRVPMHHLASVVVFGNIGISTPLMYRLAEDGIARWSCSMQTVDSKRDWKVV